MPWLSIEQSVYCALALLVTEEACADYHNNCKYEQIIYRLYLVCLECTVDHKYTCADRKRGEYKSLYGLQVLTLYHHTDEDGNVERIECYNWELVILKRDYSRELTSDKSEFPLQHPYYRDGKADE